MFAGAVFGLITFATTLAATSSSAPPDSHSPPTAQATAPPDFENADSGVLLAQADQTAQDTSAGQTDAADQYPELMMMEEIIVTGTASAGRTKFASSVGISTFSSDDISKSAPASTADLVSQVPGFWVESTAGTTQGNVFARGIIQDGGYRYVGLMEDGIPIYPVFELSFYNPDQ
ncbi:MAG: Plug domain-containing protein, partial [Saprospiraceae bacterium]|nr:Plug domain-containing protein [Saprospiraceae bacterium]